MVRPPVDQIRDDFFASQRRYAYRALLGHGGMGVVFRAHDLELDEEIAVKVMLRGIDVGSADALARFKREAQLTRKVKHPNVARLFDFGVAAGIPYVTMELVAGRALSERIREAGRIQARQLVPILRQVALGTAAAHALGIIHRDLKPQNVMVDDDGAVAILDFGLARSCSAESSGLTGAGEILGTPHYLAPELAEGAPAAPPSDIWAIGVVAFAALTGEVPFTSTTPLGLFVAIARAPLPEEKLTAAGVPGDVVAIVRRCLQKEPAARYQSASELAADLALADLELMTSGEEEAWPEVTSTQRIRARVLVADADAGLRGTLHRRLETAGCEVLEAGNGEEALLTLQEKSVDLVVMSVQMPRLDGFDATRVLRAQPRFAKLPILLLSRLWDRGRLAFAIQAGATDLIPRQQSLTPVLERIAALLGMASSAFGLDGETTKAVAPPRPRPR